jgi:hypothetical protein
MMRYAAASVLLLASFCAHADVVKWDSVIAIGRNACAMLTTGSCDICLGDNSNVGMTSNHVISVAGMAPPPIYRLGLLERLQIAAALNALGASAPDILTSEDKWNKKCAINPPS